MSWLRRPLAPGEIVGYIIFVAGVLLGIWLVLSPWADNWAYWAHDIPIFLLTNLCALPATIQVVSRNMGMSCADNWAYWAHDIPIFLLTTWIVAGSAHRFVRTFLLACVISAVASSVLFVIFVKAYTNEMGGVVLIAYGFYAFLISLAVGVPFVLYRRAQHRGTTVTP